MPGTIDDKDLLLLLNDASSNDLSISKLMKFLKKLNFSGELSALVLGAKGDKVGTKLADRFKGMASNVAIKQTDVAFPTHNEAPIVNDNVSIEDLFLDTTKKFSVEKRLFDLVLGRAIVCLCGTNMEGGPCGFPHAGDQAAAKFLRRVGKSLKPKGIAYLHGDTNGSGMGPKAYKYWAAAKQLCEQYGGKGTPGKEPDWFTIDLLLSENDFVGIKITRKAV